MRKYKIGLCGLGFLLVLAACNGDAGEAAARLDKAEAYYEAGDFFSARNEIDSVRLLYPKEVDALKRGLELMRRVDYKEAQRNLAYCDSLLPIREKDAEELKAGFVLEKDTAFQEIGNYIWKQQTIERNVQRCYIRCGVDEQGEMYLASVYFGAKPIKHSGIKLSVKGDLFAETPSIPYDGGLNYRFEDMGNTTEVVTYKGEAGRDAIQFIYDHAAERIRTEYTGGKPYVIYIADGDKKALVATYNLASALSDIERMKNERGKAEKKMAYLEQKLSQGKEDKE